MTFQPLEPGFEQSLLGAADPVKFVDINRPDVSFAREGSERFLEERVHPSERESNRSFMNLEYTIIIIIISALIFVAVISLYDVVRNIISNFYIEQTLRDPRSDNTEQEIIAGEVASTNSLISSIIFAVITIVTAAILIYF